MARVTGIGGVFLRAKDPKALAAWYARELNIALNDFGGISFDWKDEGPAGSGMTAWSTFPDETKYFGPGHQAVMINYRVDDIDAVVASLKASGTTVDDKRMDESYGRFAWATDPEGNRFELWQPVAKATHAEVETDASNDLS